MCHSAAEEEQLDGGREIEDRKRGMELKAKTEG